MWELMAAIQATKRQAEREQKAMDKAKKEAKRKR